MITSPKILLLGGSKNIGYYAAIRLLEEYDATVTFILRKPACFDQDATIQRFVQSGKARLVKGDAMVEQDVRNAWEQAVKGPNREGIVDFVLSTVGGTPTMSMKGVSINPPNVCSQSILTVLRTIPSALRVPPAQPRIIVISSTGATKASHDALPLPLRVTYPWLLDKPHKDKAGLERVVDHVVGREWSAQDAEPGTEHLEANWQSLDGMPGKGDYKEICVVRPAFLTDGVCKGSYRTSTGEGEGGIISGYYIVSRQDVAHFLVEGVVKDWDTWKGKRVSIGY